MNRCTFLENRCTVLCRRSTVLYEQMHHSMSAEEPSSTGYNRTTYSRLNPCITWTKPTQRPAQSHPSLLGVDYLWQFLHNVFDRLSLLKVCPNRCGRPMSTVGALGALRVPWEPCGCPGSPASTIGALRASLEQCGRPRSPVGILGTL